MERIHINLILTTIGIQDCMTNSAKYFLLDVFTKNMFGGNQLAVFPEGQYVKEELMQKIARELQLSETVFIQDPVNQDSNFSMRIFTPTMELPTAGHPTIGSAFYMVRHIEVKDDDVKLNLLIDQKVGTIKAAVDLDNGVPMFTNMIQPLPEFGKIYDNRAEFAKMLNLETNDLMDLPIQTVSCGVEYVIIPVKDLKSVQEINFNTQIWESLKNKLGIKFVYAFTMASETEGCHVHGRMFAPEAGIIEDAATGSANGPLGCYIYNYDLMPKTNNVIDFVSEQGFEIGRPSYLHITITGNGTEITEVKVGGECVLVGQGELFLYS